ncbi:MAG: hypothetical protein CL609_22245 [Anaerolineaceae bacterium]|nr:hypothetical protein [Anaerolineaceae bacterium]
MTLHLSKKTCQNNFLIQIIVLISNLYMVFLMVWSGLNHFFHDKWFWLFILNSFGIYLFIPFPIFIIFSFLFRKKSLYIVTVVTALLFTYFFASYFLPKPGWFESTNQPKLTVMTFNTLGANQSWENTGQVFLNSDADIIAIQELNSNIAKTIQEKLSLHYPYQALYPQEGTCGTGIISRYPIIEVEMDFTAPYWCPDPQVAKIDFSGQAIILINFHAKASSPTGITRINDENWIRQEQISEIIRYTQTLTDPYLVVGDLNASSLSGAYHSIVQIMNDAWSEGGWGLGHTFPGGNTPGGSRFKIAGYHLPQWLVRIDYIFLSSNWATQRTWIGNWDRGSDHRPVITTIFLK